MKDYNTEIHTLGAINVKDNNADTCIVLTDLA
jgi:hypothetical protein